MTPKEHIKRYWFTYLLIAIILYMLYLLLSVPKPIQAHDTENAKLKNENKVLTDSLAEFRKRDAVNSKVIIQTDSALRSTRSNLEVSRKELTKTRTKADRLAEEVKTLQPEDTSLYAHKVDSLVEQVHTYAFLLDDAVKQYDSLNILYDQQKITYEKMLTDRAGIINQIQIANKNVTAAYDGLYKDYGKVSKRLRLEQVKTKVTAVVAVAEAVLLLLKK